MTDETTPRDITPLWEGGSEQPVGGSTERRQDPRGEPTVDGLNPNGIEQVTADPDREDGVPPTHTGAPD